MSERWSTTGKRMTTAPDIDAFLADLVDVCRKHDMALGHEDTEGGFLVSRGFSASAMEWLLQASIDDRPAYRGDWRSR